jgi:membrane protein YqaA with SNARE-associated domain
VTDLLVQPVGPDVPLVIGILSGLDMWAVLIMVLVGSYLALLLSYYLGRSIGAAGIERIVGRKSFAKIEKYKMRGKWFMFISALTPVPYIPYLAGLWNFSLKDNILYVMVPRTIRFVLVLVLAKYTGFSSMLAGFFSLLF